MNMSAWAQWDAWDTITVNDTTFKLCFSGVRQRLNIWLGINQIITHVGLCVRVWYPIISDKRISFGSEKFSLAVVFCEWCFFRLQPSSIFNVHFIVANEKIDDNVAQTWIKLKLFRLDFYFYFYDSDCSAYAWNRYIPYSSVVAHAIEYSTKEVFEMHETVLRLPNLNQICDSELRDWSLCVLFFGDDARATDTHTCTQKETTAECAASQDGQKRHWSWRIAGTQNSEAEAQRLPSNTYRREWRTSGCGVFSEKYFPPKPNVKNE